jgi:hypothetical protein
MAVLDPYPKAFRDLLSGVPFGMPRHDWINKVAFYGIRYRSGAKLETTLNRIAIELGWQSERDFSQEISRAVRDAQDSLNLGLPASGERTPDWPAPSMEARNKRSSFPPLFTTDESVATAREAWQRIFDPNDLVCAGPNEFSAETRPRDEWFDFLDGLQFVVPNAMSALEGQMRDGKMSARCRGNAPAKRRWIILETDLSSSLQEQASVLSSLNHPRCPLSMAVFSGGKSIHGWFDAKLLSPAEQTRWFRHAVYLGHDPKLWLPWQWVRSPGGRRGNQTVQKVLFLT